MDYRRIGTFQRDAQAGPAAAEVRDGPRRLDACDLDDLGHAALLERLARALARRRQA